MTLNEAGIDLIKSFESCRLAVYLDLRGLLTVGWGNRTTLPVGARITQPEADKLLSDKLSSVCQDLTNCIKIPLTDNQFSALVCFAYNVGDNAFKSSTLLKKLNSGDVVGASEQLTAWDLASGVVVPGLLRRRIAEQKLFNSI